MFSSQAQLTKCDVNVKIKIFLGPYQVYPFHIKGLKFELNYARYCLSKWTTSCFKNDSFGTTFALERGKQK